MAKNPPVSISENAKGVMDEWLNGLDHALSDPSINRYDLMRQVNMELALCDGRKWEDAYAAAKTPSEKMRLLNLDARNSTLEPEYYAEKDPEKFDRVKPLLHAWQVFDSTPLGTNIQIGQQYRYTLAKHIFKKIGKNVKFFRFVEFSFGYNITCGDNVVFHRFVLVDDRYPVDIGDRASMSDFVNIYSHTHDVLDQGDITCKETNIGPGARLTYHTTVLAGSHIGEDAMVGSLGVVSRPIEKGQVAIGIPAKARKSKNEIRRERGMPEREYPS